MGTIEYDESGEMLMGGFYRLHIPFEDVFEDDERPNWIKSDAPEADSSWVKVRFSSTTRHDCSLDAKHTTEHVLIDPEGDVYGAGPFCPLVRDGYCASVVLTAPFAKQLEGSGLRGFACQLLPLRSNQSDQKNADLRLLGFQGKIRPRAQRVQGAPNACPHCGHAPLLCSECGETDNPCRKCGQMSVVGNGYQNKKKDPRIVAASIPKNGIPLSGASWDGSDFMQGFNQGIVSRRALDWLLSVHA